MRARSFFYVCLGVLALALAYHLGASTAQAGYQVNGFATYGNCGDMSFAMTPNGDIYRRNLSASNAGPLELVGNFWAGTPTPVQQESMGQLKVRYR